MECPKEDARPHNDDVCGIDWETDCDDCRVRYARARAVEHITERLKSHDMPAAYLAAALFPHIEEIYERRLEGMVRAYVALCLAQARVYGEVRL